MANVRLFPPETNISTTSQANGRSYSCAPGGFLDVPDFDAAVLQANGWLKAADGVGATAQRPAKPTRGQSYHDTTLGMTVIYTAGAWRHPVTGASV